MAPPKGVSEDVRRSLRIDVARVNSFKSSRRFSFELASVHGDRPFAVCEPILSQESTQASAIPSNAPTTTDEGCTKTNDEEIVEKSEEKRPEEALPLALLPSQLDDPFSRSIADRCVCVGGQDAGDMRWVEKHLRLLNFNVGKWVLTRTNKHFVYLEGGPPERQRLLRRGVLALMKEGRPPCLVVLSDPSRDANLAACLHDCMKEGSQGRSGEMGIELSHRILQQIHWAELSEWLLTSVAALLKELMCPRPTMIGPLIRAIA